MKLNTEYWGTGKPIENRHFDDGDYIGINETMPVMTAKTPLNQEIDQSILIGTRFKNPNSILMWFDKGFNNENGWVEFNRFSPPIDTGVFLGVCQENQDGAFNDRYRQRIGYGVNSSQCVTRPVLKFPFKTICFLVNIIASPTENTWTGQTKFICDDYFGTKNETDYPYICQIELIPYVGNNKNRTRASGWYGYLSPLLYGTYTNYALGDDLMGNDVMPFTNIIGETLTFGYNYPTSSLENSSFNTYDFIACCPYGAELWEFNRNSQSVSTHFLGGRKDVLKIIANTGFFCATTMDSVQHADLKNITDPHIIIGKMNEEGAITDTPLEGKDINDNTQQTKWNKTEDTGNGFNGIENTDPNNYTDKIDLNKPTLSNVNVFNRSFAVNSNNVRQLADFLWNADETKFNEIVKGLALMGENPMNGIIDLRLFPFNVALKNSATQAEPIVIGRTNTGVNGIKLTENVNSLIDLGECTFFEKFKNFLDFEPYTTAQLYIPYIGVVPVSTAEFMGHKISAKMLVDYTTGAGTAIVFKDDIPFIYKNGVVGITIPMTGNDSASYANTVVGNVVNGAIGGVTSIASGNIGGMVSSAEKLYSGFATGTNYQTASASSPSVATWQPQKCYFIIDRPILNVPDNYGRTVGYACEQTGKLSDFKGFTVVSNPEISFKCTETEKTMLSQLLTTGVFI